MDRRNFLGFAVASAPLAATVGMAAVMVTPNARARVTKGIDWMNELDPEKDVYSRLGCYKGRITEQLLLGAIETCGKENPHTITLSTKGCQEYLELFAGERRYSAYDVGPPLDEDLRVPRYEPDTIMFMAPGKHMRIEVHLGLPPGFLTVG